ncbi:MerR family transcriptional regulator [Paenibacillus pinihumi]|uniref:MerR family transcriptional regulator n=1 Tax=Paenibacillus pinihumi TaxID=669462 RepID=UPI000425A6B6|nr:MerR family transcriptional regulator [Paenibacillus pinihumi]
MEGYLRGQAAEMAGINLETLRYYGKLGLIETSARTPSGYRLYPEESIVRLAFIRNAKLCGFTLREIKKALTRSEGSGIRIEDFVNVIERKVSTINREIPEREHTKSMLDNLKSSLLDKDRDPGVQELLRILKIE